MGPMLAFGVCYMVGYQKSWIGMFWLAIEAPKYWRHLSASRPKPGIWCYDKVVAFGLVTATTCIVVIVALFKNSLGFIMREPGLPTFVVRSDVQVEHD